jgi:hypothetical protein
MSRRAAPVAAPVATAKPVATPPVVERAVAGPGRPLDDATLAWFEPRFGRDLSSVRVFTDERSAAALGAEAYTVGDRIVFRPGAYVPGTPGGRRLLAHELTHVVQQVQAPAASRVVGPSHDAAEAEADRVADGIDHAPAVVRARAGGALQRRSPWAGLVGLFAGEDFSQDDLLAYLADIDRRNGPQDYNESDNMARAVVRGWAAGSKALVITPQRAAILVEEMVRGATLDDDEQAILTLLYRADDAGLLEIFRRTTPALLIDNFHGSEEGDLLAFFNRRFAGGAAAVRDGRITPVGAPLTLVTGPAPDPAQEAAPVAGCMVRAPGSCPTFESWIEQFDVAFLDKEEPVSFTDDRTDHTVLGKKAKKAAGAEGTESEIRPPLVRDGKKAYLPTDRYIQGPHIEWLNKNLPPELVQTAYQLACDCADLAVILRHVWLVAHRRTEVFVGSTGTEWTLGARLADSRSRTIGALISGGVWSGNVERLLRPYVDADGKPLRSFAALAPLLRVGDVLAWDHEDGSGHVHTIVDIDRVGNRITRIWALQGNQPIGERTAEKIIAEEAKAPSVAELRAAPGRRIEVGGLKFKEGKENELKDDPATKVWTWHEGTTLVAAGPPAWRVLGVEEKRPAGLGDWVPLLAKVPSVDVLLSRIEAALLDARAAIQGGRPVDVEGARRFADAAGARLWTLAKQEARHRAKHRAGNEGLQAEDLGEESHYRPLLQVLGMMESLRRLPGGAPVATALKTAFERAARGITTADAKLGDDAGAVRVLVTAFDPFAFASGQQVAPPRGAWNPSGAAALAIDGETVPTGDGVRAAVEAVILPVSYGEFRAGLVERLLEERKPAPEAVITVSEDPNVRVPRVEHFAVGVHNVGGVEEDIPPAPGGTVAPPILASRGVADIGAEAGIAATDLTRGVDVTVRFFDVATAEKAAAFFGGTANGTEVTLVGDNRVKRFASSGVRRGMQDRGLLVTVAGTVVPFEVVEGPGGNFLSNEVSYRTLRWIATGGPARQDMVSFHLHTEAHAHKPSGGVDIPQAAATDAEKQARSAALGNARGVRDRTIETLRRLIATVARRLRRPRPRPRP